MSSTSSDGERSSCGASPANRNSKTAIMLAWRNARDTYRKSLPDKDFKQIMIPARPDDVLREIETWQSGQVKSRYCRVADSIHTGISRLQKFDRAVDLMAQGTPAPGCLLWGSIIFVLTIVHNAAEEYSKLCKALVRMTECLPRIELYTDTFLDSSIVQDCITAFYSSVLRFWTRACKFYRRRRLWNFGRVIWSDYEAEFGELELDMARCRERVEESALAVHIGESKVARTQQQTAMTSLSEAQNSSRQKKIIAWLAPTVYAVDYYKEDFENAKAARHASTCQWIVARDAFIHFSQVSPSGGSFLWIYAQPGAGKTVLAAFLIDHIALHQQPCCVLFFFCKDTDDDKRSSIAIARSLLYQLFQALRQRAMMTILTEEISLAIEESGHKRALKFDTVWKIFTNHISNLAPATIVVDALDECHDLEIIIKSLRSMADTHNVGIILTSRKEDHLYQLLHSNPSLEVTPDDIDADIKAFVEAKVSASPRLSHPSVSNLVIKRLCESHEGMFLWVQYMLKELRSCVSLEQVQEELQELPKGLDAVYRHILERLQDTLDKQTFKLCSKVLTWVTGSLRPLRIDELRQALESHYRYEGQTLLSADGLFPYSDKDIELVCGSLVTVRNGTLQVVHLTVKQYIKSPSWPSTSRLLAGIKSTDLQLSLACLTLIRHNCVEPITKLFSQRPIGADEDEHDLSLLRSKTPFLEYACFSWMIHLTNCTRMEAMEVSRCVHRTFDSPATFGWIESWMILQPQDVPRLLIGLEEVCDWINRLQRGTVIADDSSYSFALNWCTTMEQVLKEYSPLLEFQPAEIYYLDFAMIFAARGLTETYDKHGGLMRREKCLRFSNDRIPRPARKNIPPFRLLQMPFKDLDLALFIYEPNRDIYISSPYCQLNLFAQSASSGKRLPPLRDPEFHDDGNLLSYAISGNGNHLGVVFARLREREQVSIAIWEIEANPDFTRRMHARPWARIVHRSTIEEESIARIWCGCWFGIDMPCIAFDRDGVFTTPNGLVRTVQGVSSFSPDNPLRRLSEMIHIQLSDIRCSFYSQDGKFLFILSSEKITKYSLPDLRVQFERTLSFGRREVRVASPSGRYFTFRNLSKNGPLLLVDTILDKNVVLPHPANSEYEGRDYVFRFSVDETEVISCHRIEESGFPAAVVCCYAGLPSDVRLRTSLKYFCDPMELSVGFSVSDDHRTARLITTSAEILRIQLGNEIHFLDAPDMPNEYPNKSVFLSRDGSRWASVYHGNAKAQVNIYTTLNPSELPQCFQLQRSSSLGKSGPRFITMSMDLSILVMDADIYSLRDSKIGGLPMIHQCLKLQTEPAVQGSTWKLLPPQCSVDYSNSFVVYHMRNRGDATGANHPDGFALFRISIDDASSLQLQPSLPEDMCGISSQFHPSIPLLVLGFGLISEVDALSSRDAMSYDYRIPFHVVIINLQSMSKRVVELEAEIEGHIMVQFSSSGDFVYIRSTSNYDDSEYQTIQQNIELPSASPRCTERFLAIDGTFYELTKISTVNSFSLNSTKAEPARRNVATNRVWLGNLVNFSSLPTGKCRLFLILGKTDNDHMHALMVPEDDGAPELKTIPLTWAEARAILDEMWEGFWGSVDSDVDPDTNPDLDSDMDLVMDSEMDQPMDTE